MTQTFKPANRQGAQKALVVPAVSLPGRPHSQAQVQLARMQVAHGNQEMQRLLRRKPSTAATTAHAGGPSAVRQRGTAPPIVHKALNSPGQTMDPTTRAFMEPRFGHNFRDVRIHTDSLAAESASAVNALAYAVGRDVVFGSGQYSPRTQAGSRLLAHELAHTLQNPDGGRVMPFLEVGRVDDPAERAADRTADAALRGEQVPISPFGGSVLRRQARTCTAHETNRADQRIVSCGDADYRVTMTTSRSAPSSSTRTSVNAGYNGTNIFLTINVCRGGTEVQIEPLVDLPRALGQALGNALAGSDVLAGATLSPGFDLTVVQSDSFTLRVGPRITVDRNGAAGGSLGATLTTRGIEAQADLSYDARAHAGFLTFTFSPGSPTRHVDCHREGQTHLVLQCEQITHHPGVPEVPRQTVPEDEVRYLFFDYPTANIRRNFRLPTDIQSLYDQGYRATSIEGFTSPEGPRPRETAGFEGNILLGQERADAALAWLHEVCPNCEFGGVTPRGRSELPPALGAVVPEPRGTRMEREAVDEFLGTGPGQTPDALAPHDPAELDAFRRLPRSRQRNQAFELMRRAEIRFHRDRVVREHRDAVAQRDEFKGGDTCSDDVANAARASFGTDRGLVAPPRQ
jgi:hypothetical protein